MMIGSRGDVVGWSVCLLSFSAGSGSFFPLFPFISSLPLGNETNGSSRLVSLAIPGLTRR